MPIVRGLKFVRTPTSGPKVSRLRVCAAASVLIAMIAAATAVPLPMRVTAPVVLEPRDARRVYISEPGVLEWAVRPGDVVEAGQTLASLANPDLDLEITRLEGQCARQRLRLENLKRRRGEDRAVAAEIPTAQEALVDLEQRLVTRRADQERLTLKAPVAGTVLPPDWHSAPREAGAVGLARHAA